MPVRVRFGYDEQDLLAAQWAVLEAFIRQLRQGWAEPAARQALRAVSDALPHDPAGPAATAATLAERLVAQVAELLAAREPAALQAAQTECAYLQRQVARYQADPLAAQVARLTAEHAAALQHGAQLAQQVADLEAALAQAPATHARVQQHLQAEIARWQAENRALQRIVATQQLQLLGPDSAPENPPRKPRG